MTRQSGPEEHGAGEAAGGAIPRPVMTKMRWPFPVVWVVPVLALLVAGWYWRERVKDRGPEIVVTFGDAAGLRAGETPVTYRGIEVGRVEGIGLTEDLRGARVVVRLNKSAGAFAKTGARFWVVRPVVTVGSVTNLGTVLTGPYISAIPGQGEEAKGTFIGMEEAPPSDRAGVRVVLHTPELPRLTEGAPVYYRGVQVGEIREIRLASDASNVEVRVFIEHRYTPVVRKNSRFWAVAAADVKAGLFSGVDVKIGALKTLLSGGVAFATPDTQEPVAEEGEGFRLYEESRKEWLEWAPKVELLPEVRE